MGLSQSFTWFAFIVLAYYGSHLMITEGKLTVADIVGVSQFITFGTQVAAEAITSAPNYYKAKMGCGRVLKLVEMTPKIKRNVGTKISTDRIIGKLEFYRVNFAYPTRPTELILHNVSFRCEAAKHIAVVGPSGCGMYVIN
jgi:ABC-type multidrug transport system fused ATPase/permease subunit